MEYIQEQIAQKERELKALKEKLKEATKDKIYCNHCKDYLGEDQVTKEQYVDTVYGECVYAGADLDDGIYADVTYLNTIRRCPKCGEIIYRNRIQIKQENKRGRF